MARHQDVHLSRESRYSGGSEFITGKTITLGTCMHERNKTHSRHQTRTSFLSKKVEMESECSEVFGVKGSAEKDKMERSNELGQPENGFKFP